MVDGNRHYEEIKKEVVEGLAEIELYKGSQRQADDLLEEKEIEARVWRNNELGIADIDLNKEQDGVTNHTVAIIREWRNTLRDWPSTDIFPDMKPNKPY